ncbi:hypothetical protein ACSFBX_20610 [Variovorax sp. RB2P76]|uniref:hypothetical protein n=1 Tax=Variovorax sp. RB2P76 TaxID=3443736 RepID=UPI003F46F305
MPETIDLTNEEQKLLADIDFHPMQHFDEKVKRSLAAAATLTPMLLRRGAIPERRLRYFTSSEWGPRGKSRKDNFEGNGTRGAEIFAHGNFLRYLRFFIHGANLPQLVINAVRDQIGNLEWFSSGDLEPLRKLVRRLAREHSLDTRNADDFMQLCADLGLSATDADSICRAVKQVKS